MNVVCLNSVVSAIHVCSQLCKLVGGGGAQGRIQDLAMGGARFVGKRVTYTSEVSYERSELRAKRV